MTTKDAIKHLSDKIDYAEQCDDKWVDSVSIKALYIAVRAMAEERKKGRYIDAEELKHILNNSKYYGTKAGNAFADMITECKSIEERKTGKWIDDGKGLYMCSSCGKLWVHWWARVVPLDQMREELRYCPMCGSYNGEENENE